MSVISRLLYGSFRVKAFDLFPPEQEDILLESGAIKSVENPQNGLHKRFRLARLRKDTNATAPFTTELLPNYCNIHEFVADDHVGCAILDILTPPYNSR